MAIVALGSNLGDSRAIIERAADRLRGLTDEPVLVSGIYETAPVDCPPGSPSFLNAVIAMVPRQNDTPESLLAALQALETGFGRQPRTVLNEPRPLDLDLIMFGDMVRNTPELTLPHPRAHQRRFVLAPLNDVAPGLVLPGQTKSVEQLLALLPDEPQVRQLSPARK